MSTDIYSSAKRSEIMRRVRSKDSKPEKRVRSTLHRMGYRFRLHREDLPGKPDIVLPKYHSVIFVHGCFWHQHLGCAKATYPQSNAEFWKVKLEENVRRDQQNVQELQERGWRVLIVWECHSRHNDLDARLAEFLRHE